MRSFCYYAGMKKIIRKVLSLDASREPPSQRLRDGGAVSLAVGMASILSNIPGLKGLMPYWYNFALMFEAMFVLTAVDTGTRVARFLVQELGGRPRGDCDLGHGDPVASPFRLQTAMAAG